MPGVWRECKDPEPQVGTMVGGQLGSEEGRGYFFAEGSHHKLCPPLWSQLGAYLSIPFLRLYF